MQIHNWGKCCIAHNAQGGKCRIAHNAQGGFSHIVKCEGGNVKCGMRGMLSHALRFYARDILYVCSDVSFSVVILYHAYV